MNSNGRPTRLVVGSFLIVFSMVLVGASAYLLSSHSKIVQTAEADQSTQACKTFLLQSSANLKTKKDGVTAFWRAEKNIESKIARAAAALGECESLELKNFCAGLGCSNPGVSLVLKSASRIDP
jgi:hypothetical protein